MALDFRAQPEYNPYYSWCWRTLRGEPRFNSWKPRRELATMRIPTLAPARPLAALLVGLLALGPLSCGKAKPKADRPVFPVAGRLLVKKQPAVGAQVRLFPLDEAARARDWPDGYPHGVTGPDGVFRLSTFAPDDGAPEGEYLFLVRWPKPGGEGGDGDVDQLGERYFNPQTARIRVRVEPQSNDWQPINLP